MTKVKFNNELVHNTIKASQTKVMEPKKKGHETQNKK